MRKMVLGKKIREMRQQLNLSARQLASLVGCSPNTIIEIEEGETKAPSVWRIRKIADHLSVPLDWLTDNSADFPPPTSVAQEAASMVEAALTGAGLAGELTDDERELLAAWRRLNDRRRGELLGMARGWGDADRVVSPAETARRTTEMVNRAGPKQSRKDTG